MSIVILMLGLPAPSAGLLGSGEAVPMEALVSLGPGVQPEPVVPRAPPSRAGGVLESGPQSHANVLHDQELTRDSQLPSCPSAPTRVRDFDVNDGYANSWIHYDVATATMRIDWYYSNDGVVWIWKSALHDVGPGTWCWMNWQNLVNSAMQARPGQWQVEVYFGGDGGFRSGSRQCAGPTTNCAIPFDIWPKIKAGGTYGSTPGDGDTTFRYTDGEARVYMDWNTARANYDHTIRFHWYRPDGTEHHVGDVLWLNKGSTNVRLLDSLDIQATGADQYPGTWEVRPWIDTDHNYFHEARYFFDLEIDCSPDPDGDGLDRCQEVQQGTDNNDPDTDGDGLSDLVESTHYSQRDVVFCHTTNGNCEYPEPLRRDLYIELDWMDGHPLSDAERATFVDQFLSAPINMNQGSGDDVILHLDAGELGNGGQTVPFQQFMDERDFQTYKQNFFEQNRQGIYRYGLVACSYNAQNNVFGWAEGPGDDFAIYDCAPDMGDADAQAKELMHEVGHLMLGWFLHHPSCNNLVDGTGTPLTVRHNPNLGHFDARDRGDCNGDGVGDISAHPLDRHDVMVGGGPTNKQSTTYRAPTWDALRLDWGIDGTVPDCTSLVPAEVTDPVGGLFPGFLQGCTLVE